MIKHEIEKELERLEASKALLLEKISYWADRVNEAIDDSASEKVAALLELSEQLGYLKGVEALYRQASEETNENDNENDNND